MEGLAAFALACNVIQVVDSASKAVSVIYKTYKTGATEENIELENTSKHFLELSKNLSTSLKSTQAQSSNSPVDSELQGLASECLQTAEKLQQELDYLKSRGSRLERLRTSFHAFRKEDGITKLEKRLRDQETLLNTGLLLRLREQNDMAAVLQQVKFESLDKTLQQFVNRLADGHIRVSALVRSQNETTRQLIGQEHTDTRAHLEKRLNDFHLETITEDQRLRFLNSLRYEEMNGRPNQISATYPKTFGWIFDETAQKSWPSFNNWLKQGSGIYWVQGKAGSGKSTLMKFITKDERTKGALRVWSAPKEPMVLSFFFWLVGTPLQRNLHGLLSSLLHQLLGDHDQMTIKLLRNKISLQRKSYVQDWDTQELSELLRTVARQQAQDTPLCVFLDGLDEYEQKADFGQLMTLIHDLSVEKDIKVCVSSRPEQHIRNELNTTQFLRVQDLTEADIRHFVSNKLEKAFQRGPVSVDVPTQEALVSILVSKAEGVFLWVNVALHDILRGLTKHDTYDELLHRVSRLPTDVERLYEDMLQRLGDDWQLYRQEAALYFKICLFSSGGPEWPGLPLMGASSLIYYAVSARKLIQKVPPLSESDVDLHELLRQCDRTELRIMSCCAGMLEIGNVNNEAETDGTAVDSIETDSKETDGTETDEGVLQGTSRPNSSDTLQKAILRSERIVSFSHRTVVDFLTQKPAGQEVLVCSPADDAAIFRSAIEALQMMYITGIRKAPDFEAVGNLLQAIANFGKDPLAFPKLELCKILQSIEHTLRVVYASCQSPDQDVLHSVYNPSRAYDGYMYAVDFMGLTLEVGLPEYFEHEFDSMLQMKQHPGRVVKANYKNYLLFCASGNENCVNLLERLLKAGADPNATIYLPVSYSHKISPWFNFLSQGGFAGREDTIKRFLTAGANLQELGVFEFMLYDGNPEFWRHWRKYPSMFEVRRIMVELNAAYLLREHLKGTNDQASLLQHPSLAEVQSHRRVLLLRPEVQEEFVEVRSLEGSESLLAMMDDWIQKWEEVPIRMGSPKVPSEDEKIQIRMIKDRITEKVRELYHQSDKVDLLEFIEQRGYYKHQDYHTVLQGPFERFEDVTEKPEELLWGQN